MRNAMVQLCLVIIGVSSIHAVKLLQSSSLQVRISPAGGVDHVWAIQGKDTLEMIDIRGEYILRNIRPGCWQIVVDANAPYRDCRILSGAIRPGADSDLGEIQLQNR